MMAFMLLCYRCSFLQQFSSNEQVLFNHFFPPLHSFIVRSIVNPSFIIIIAVIGVIFNSILCPEYLFIAIWCQIIGEASFKKILSPKRRGGVRLAKTVKWLTAQRRHGVQPSETDFYVSRVRLPFYRGEDNAKEEGNRPTSSWLLRTAIVCSCSCESASNAKYFLLKLKEKHWNFNSSKFLRPMKHTS